MLRTARMIAGRVLLSFVLLGMLTQGIVVSEDKVPGDKDEQIGEVLGQPVYRRDLTDKSKDAGELHRLFLLPVLDRYKADHKKEVQPTNDEIAAATLVLKKEFLEKAKGGQQQVLQELKDIDGQLAKEDLPKAKKQELQKEKRALEEIKELNQKGPGRSFAVFMLANWKFQKHLYDNYGGGRVLWQQGGTEAFDAMRKFLEAREKEGDFKISDPALRKQYYEYWTTHDHGSFLSDKPETIKDFTEPAWAPKPSANQKKK